MKATAALLRALLWLGASMSALGAEEVRIKNVDEFVQFSSNVIKGTSYSGTTVFLESDLSLAGKTFEPIGTKLNHFHGVFDGQGHVISNLIMNSSSSFYAGLFGYSAELTIKNVILDSSCSITSSYSGSDNAYIGGIIGYCYAEDGACTIENSVNMGGVSFSGDISSHSYIGGIVGYLSSPNHNSIVKNCANYGEVTHSGESYNSRIGGIVGYSYGSSSTNKTYIYNSLNHGTITFDGTTTNGLSLGGIAGRIYYTTIENCVSGGKILIDTTAPTNSYIGSTVGYVSSDTTINYTYFTSDLNDYDKFEYLDPTSNESNTLSYDSTTFELNGTVSIGDYTGTSLISALNAVAVYYVLRDYSYWLLNKGKNAVSFTINERTNSIRMDSQIILLPSLASEGNMSFDGWYTDSGLTTLLKKFEDTSETGLYGKYFCLNFTVTLDANGGDELAVDEMVIGCDRVYGDLPTPTRTEATFLGWFTERTDGDKVESGDKVTILSNHTLYAHWSINNYTLTLIFGNGDVNEVRVLEFNETIFYPKNVTKEGYIFNGWSPKLERMSGSNINVTALWIEITPDLVEIVFEKKDMTEEEIKEVIKGHTEENFAIVKIEDDETGEIKVIVEFIDAGKAEEFVRSVNAAFERGEGGKIKKVGLIQGPPSFSPAHCPMSLLYLI